MHKKRLRKKIGKRYRSRLIDNAIEQMHKAAISFALEACREAVGFDNQVELEEADRAVCIAKERVEYLTAIAPESAYRLSLGLGARQISAVKSVR